VSPFNILDNARRNQHCTFYITLLHISLAETVLLELLPYVHYETFTRRNYSPHCRMYILHQYIPRIYTPLTCTLDLEPSELVNLQHVSRQFLNLSRDNNLWKTLCFSHSIAERRRRRLEAASDVDPRLAELITAANNISNAFDTSVHNPLAPSAEAQIERNKEKRWDALRANWDPSYPEEKVNWYQDFIQRHAPQQVGWFQDAGNEGRDEEEVRREATGAGILFDGDGLADKLIAPLDDGSIRIWDACASSEKRGRILACYRIEGRIWTTPRDLARVKRS
jgi:hypothetical protein